MSAFKNAYLENELKRWMRPDAHRFIRSDWRRFVKPGSDLWSVYELYERKYRADQPRDDYGRWTNGGGTQLAQYDAQKREPISLEAEEARGGHTIDAHVNRGPEALKAQALAAFDTNPKAEDSRSGSFSSLAAANKLVNSTLSKNQDIVDEVASGLRDVAVVSSDFGSVTGIEAVAPNIRSQPYVRETYGVGVVIVHDPFASRGYRILTAFPSNE
jgi:hypothetical protein